MAKLNNIKIKNAAPGTLNDGDRLMLIKGDDVGKWVFRYTFAKRRRDMGLGAWPSVSLSEARKERDKWAAVIRSGKDPISVRNAERADAAAKLDQENPTLEEMIKLTFEAKRASLRGDGTRGRWMSPLIMHVIPKIGKRRMADIHQTDIKDAVAPIWRSKHPTAVRVIYRLRMVFKMAKLSGIECDPFTVDAAEALLGEVQHVAKHHAAMPWQEVPALYSKLGSTPSGMCLKFLILTAVRSHAARGARFDEIEADVWTVPEDRVKGTSSNVTDFRVPLTEQAMEIAHTCGEISDTVLFPSPRKGAFISDVAINKALRRRTDVATVHGFRSSFRMWVQDTGGSWEVSERILGHTVGNKVERAYARSELLEQRKVMLQSWANFVTGAEAANVVPLRG